MPGRPRRVGLWVNTATGSGAPQVQAFPARLSFNDSARESVGMYGHLYDLTIALRHDGVELTRASPTRVVRFRAMVPGFTSIPPALWLESRWIPFVAACTQPPVARRWRAP